MSTTERLEATIKTSTSDIIVAIPGGIPTKADPSIRDYVGISVLPVISSGLVYGCKSKFDLPLYKQNFLEKCQVLGANASFACI